MQRAQPTDAAGWHALGLKFRSEQRMAEAVHALRHAAQLAPSHPEIALALAQTCHASGLPAAQLFRRACALAGEQPELTRQLSIALASEGDFAAAEALLESALAVQPDWLEGHSSLARLRWIAGHSVRFLDSYRLACAAQPHQVALRLAWFHALATQRDWVAAAEVLRQGEAICADARPFVLARLLIACETLAHAEAERLLDLTASVADAGVDLCRLRYYLRTGQLSVADAVGERLCQTSSARMAWPYRWLVWRLQGDARADWLEGAPPLVRAMDSGLSRQELDQLTIVLRGLHTAHAPYIEQSVRGGTQTDRPLFFRHEPIIALLRQKMVAAVRQYIDSLPAADAAHPLLGPARDSVIRFSGSWSVRLQSQGFHVSHTHPMGWISSALYVALPEPAQLGPPPAGWIGFGAPPSELGLQMAPYQRVEPQPGKLVLFPSSTWHGTEPFAAGERLVVAFDVGVPRP